MTEAGDEFDEQAASKSNKQKLEWKEYTFPTGTVYRGGFNGTKKEGRGYWRHPEGESYEGEYHDNKQHGWGTYEFPDTGRKYMGQWSEGQMHGEGVYLFNREGTEYFIGEYNCDRKRGKGLYKYATDNRSTEQSWNNGELLTEYDAPPLIQLEYFTKRLYIQQQVHAVSRNLAISTSEKVELEFQKKLETKVYTFPSGAKYEGQFLGTKKHGRGLWSHPSGDTFEGCFRYNKHEGWGVYKIGKSGKMFVGGWKEGKMDGWGVYYFNEQKTEYFVGTYANDAKEGVGVYKFASGTVKFQNWEHGFLIAESDATSPVISDYEQARSYITEQVMAHTTSFNRGD